MRVGGPAGSCSNCPLKGQSVLFICFYLFFLLLSIFFLYINFFSYKSMQLPIQLTTILANLRGGFLAFFFSLLFMGIASFPNCFYNVFDGAGSFSAAGQLNSFPVFALSSPVVFRTFVFIFATSSGSSVHTFVVYAFSVWPIFSPANPPAPPPRCIHTPTRSTSSSISDSFSFLNVRS